MKEVPLMIKVGDLVKMKRGIYHSPGLVLEIVEGKTHAAMWVRVLWPNGDNFGLDKARDLKVISESR